MQMVLERTMQTLPMVSEDEALGAVRRYVNLELDPSFRVTGDNHANRQATERGRWRFFVCCEDGPLHAIEVDGQRGTVIPFDVSEVRVLREKAAILAARKVGVLPLDERGYVLGEYARRQASRYLGDALSMYYYGAEPVFVPCQPAVWQVNIVFKRYQLGPIMLGTLDVDARSGEPIPLTKAQIKRIRERTRAIISDQTPASEAV